MPAFPMKSAIRLANSPATFKTSARLPGAQYIICKLSKAVIEPEEENPSAAPQVALEYPSSLIDPRQKFPISRLSRAM
jgi:hypothetical protein